MKRSLLVAIAAFLLLGPARAQTDSTTGKEAWRTTLSGLQEKLYVKLDNMYRPEDRAAALTAFAADVRAGIPGADSTVWAAAIADVLLRRASGNRQISELFISIWKKESGLPVWPMITMLLPRHQQEMRILFGLEKPPAPPPAPRVAATAPTPAPPPKPAPKPQKYKVGTIVRYKNNFYVIERTIPAENRYYLRGAYPQTQEQFQILGLWDLDFLCTDWTGKPLPTFVPEKRFGEYTCSRCDGSGRMQVSEELDRGGTNRIGGTNYTLTTPAYKETISRLVTCNACYGTGKKR